MTTPSHEKLIERLIKSVAYEISSYRGENPFAVDRGGVERWEVHKPLAKSILSLPALSELLALRPAVGEATISMQDAHKALRMIVPHEPAGPHAELLSRAEAIWRNMYRSDLGEGARAVIADMMIALVSPSTVETAPVADGRGSGWKARAD